MNQTNIIGNLVANPESRIVNTANGQATVCNFTVAVNRMRGREKVTDYFRVTCWNKRAEVCMKYLLKGRKVRVTGAVTASAYKAQDGSARARLEVEAEEIEFLSSAMGNQSAPTPPPADDFVPVDDDELPF